MRVRSIVGLLLLFLGGTAFASDDASPTEDLLEPFAGRVVVLNFWASWCAPCRTELPLLDDLSKRLDPLDSVVVAVNLDRSRHRAEAVVRTLHLTMPVVFDREATLGERFSPNALPTTYVLAEDGSVLMTIEGVLDAERLAAVEAAVGLANTPDAATDITP